ncbi:LAFA_0F08658g1_1 [Lachancea sp. 'fantastica']|nr:LAFA_0F08658g1_1 [Lachancea sp. 'fantastica']
MDESIRRSSRSNKGVNQHLQRQRQAELEYVKARKVQHNSEKLVEDKPEVVKCLVCGTTDENYDEENDPNGDMIQCDTCNTWQHIKCMTGNEGADDMENYDCSLCAPSKYPNLTYAIDPDSKLEVSFTKRRADDDQNDYINDGLENVSDGVEEEIYHRPVKRKKSSKKAASFKDSESKQRESALKMFKDLFAKYIIPETTAARTFQLPPDTSIDILSNHFSGELEKELYEACISSDTGKLNDLYKEKVRVLFSNLKDQKNIDMKTLVINKKLPFNKLVKMSVNELINPDLRHFREKVDNEALDNLVLEQPDRPKYHKTHKGDELIENQNDYEPEDVIFNRDIVATKLKENAESDRGSDPSDDRSSSGLDHRGSASADHGGISRVIPTKESWACSLEYKETRTKFSGNIRFLSSSQDISNTIRRDAIGDGEFVVEGRLKDEDAESYIEQMATTRTFLAYVLKPHNNYQDSQQSEAFYEFLSSRQRYGALKAKRKYVRHVYVIPYSERQQFGVLKYIQLPEGETDLTEGETYLVVAIVRPDMFDVT